MEALIAFLTRIPAVRVLSSDASTPRWWIKLSIDIEHPLAWRVVQELGHVLNSLSVEDRLPTTFKPVSPPPYLNGGPREFLSWTIEADRDAIAPEVVAEWLEGRLPRPVESREEWDVGMDDDEG